MIQHLAAMRLVALARVRRGGVTGHLSGGAVQRVVPRQPSQSRPRSFPGLPEAEGRARRGPDSCVGSAQQSNGDPLLPVRAHIMFRNVQGLWVAQTPRAARPQSAPGVPVGVLHHLPSPAVAAGHECWSYFIASPAARYSSAGTGRRWQSHQWRLTRIFPTSSRSLIRLQRTRTMVTMRSSGS